MNRKMLINVMHPEEARVAIVQDGKLMELNIEIAGKEHSKGNICKAVVLRVEPGLQAAFVDIGHKKPGFIQMGDIHPDSWQWRDDVPEEERNKRPRIQDVIRRGQELLVQIEKDARDMKGAALTGYLSLPGRYMVLMPGDKAAGISRKIEDNAVRKELKGLVAELQVPDGYGYIVRTEAVGRTSDELKKDLDYLLGLHKRILDFSSSVTAPAEIYKDAGLILRTIRDYFSDDIDEVLVDDRDAFKQAVDFFKEIMPGCESRVKLHREKRPIFSKFQLEDQIDQLYEKRVNLPSGGSLVIEPTEALVSIDVNSGKSSGERGVEDTAFKTNLEAAAEVARQLRLRDLGGLVVIDFIDMRDNKHNKEVERTLKEALKLDKARVNLGRISQFGILEMSRQRIAKNINDAIHLECPHCEGRGRVKSVEAMALSFLRKVHASAAKGQLSEVRGALPLEVAYYLLNRKKRELAQIENDYDFVVTVKGKPSFLLNQMELEVVRKEKTEQDERQLQPEQPVEQEISVLPMEQQQQPDGQPKKKRKRRKKKKTGNLEQLSQVQEQGTDELISALESIPSNQSESDGIEISASTEQTAESVKTKPRSRSRKRKDTSALPAALPLPVDNIQEDAPSPMEQQQSVKDEALQKKPNRKRGSKKSLNPETIENGAPLPETSQIEVSARADKRKSRTQNSISKSTTPADSALSEPLSLQEESKPQGKVRAPRLKKKPVDTVSTEE